MAEAVTIGNARRTLHPGHMGVTAYTHGVVVLMFSTGPTVLFDCFWRAGTDKAQA